jgi:hypothetical protein
MQKYRSFTGIGPNPTPTLRFNLLKQPADNPLWPSPARHPNFVKIIGKYLALSEKKSDFTPITCVIDSSANFRYFAVQ